MGLPAENRTSVPEVLQLRLPVFEGPLDLLLELIRKHEVDIFDIPISLITEEYLAYMDTMKFLDLEIGGEWIEMAAMLVYIKSRLLLPKDEEDEDEDGPDPREELVERLIEYQQFQAAAEALDSRPLLERDVFTHPPQTSDWTKRLGPPRLGDASVLDLMKALRRVVDRSKEEGNWVYEITSQQLTLRSVILEIAEKMQKSARVEFDELFSEDKCSRHRVITTFLALLEMTRLKMIRLFQSKLDGDRLWIERAVVDIVEVSQELELSNH